MSSVSQIALGAAVSVAMTGRRTAAWKAALRGADPITVYGTQPVLPFSYHPFGVGSVFIIDPLCKLPLLAGAGWALASRSSARSRFENAARPMRSTAYLAWGLAAQQHLERIARASLAAQGVAPVVAPPPPACRKPARAELLRSMRLALRGWRRLRRDARVTAHVPVR